MKNSSQEKPCNLPVPNSGDLLFLFADKKGRKVPIFAPSPEEADRKADKYDISDLDSYQAFILTDITRLIN